MSDGRLEKIKAAGRLGRLRFASLGFFCSRRVLLCLLIKHAERSAELSFGCRVLYLCRIDGSQRDPSGDQCCSALVCRDLSRFAGTVVLAAIPAAIPEFRREIRGRAAYHVSFVLVCGRVL